MERWISVKEYARRIGKTTSAVYYMIANNKVEARHFAYGNKKGHLIKVEDGFHAIYDDWDIKYRFANIDSKYPNYNEVISQFKPGFAEKVLIDPLNIELIADALNARKGIRFHFPKDDSKGIKITFSDKELSLSEALLMTKLDY